MTETSRAFTELVGRRVRMGPWEDQKVSTCRKIGEALIAARWDEAATLSSYFIDEAKVCFTLLGTSATPAGSARGTGQIW